MPLRAKEILGAYLTDYTEEELQQCVDGAYAPERFGGNPAPLEKVGGRFVLELFARTDAGLQGHGAAAAAAPDDACAHEKDRREAERSCIFVATSGDTGKAALEGFQRRGRVRSCTACSIPLDGVSHVQKLQMVTTGGANNVHVIAPWRATSTTRRRA